MAPVVEAHTTQLLRDGVQWRGVMGDAGKVQSSRIRSMISPVSVKNESRETGGLDLAEYVHPHLRHWHPPVVHFTGEDKDPLTIDEDAVMIPFDDTVESVIAKRPLRG